MAPPCLPLDIKDSLKEAFALLWGSRGFWPLGFWLLDERRLLMWEALEVKRIAKGKKIAEGKRIAERELQKGNC
jgi:hypothetical protein